MEKDNKEKLIEIRNKIYLLNRIDNALLLLMGMASILFLASVLSLFLLGGFSCLSFFIASSFGRSFVRKKLLIEKIKKSKIIFEMARDSDIDDKDIMLSNETISYGMDCYSKSKVLVKNRAFIKKR